MTNPSKDKGDRAELEVQALWRDHCGVPARRALGAGRKDDVGDIHGVPYTVVQVANRKDVAAAVRHKPLEAQRQLENTHGGLFGCTFIRLRGGEYRVVMTPEQFFALWREAMA
jgi:hypothetical protein